MGRTGFVLLGLLLGVASVALAETPAGPALVKGIKVLPDKAPDCSSLKSIAESVTRGCTTNDEKAVAIYNFMQLGHYHWKYPEGGPVLREINSFGWSLCGGLHAEQSALWKELGWNWRFIGWPGHTTVEAFYDNSWHYLDVFLKVYVWKNDPKAPGGRTIASEEDLANGADTLMNTFTAEGEGPVYLKDDNYAAVDGKGNWMAQVFLACGDDVKGTFGGAKARSKPGGADGGWMGQQHDSAGYSADLNLAPGTSITNTWDGLPNAYYWVYDHPEWVPKHSCRGNKDLRTNPSCGLVLEPYFTRDRSYCNGTMVLAPDFSSAAVLQSFYANENVKYDNGAVVPVDAAQPASVTVLLQSPYVMVKAKGTADGADAMVVSEPRKFKVAELTTFKPAELADFSAAVRGKTVALAKITIKTALKALKIETVFVNNSGSLPYLSPGKNVVTVSAADASALGNNKLVVTYAYCPGCRSTSNEDLCLQGKRIAAQVDAVWQQTPTVVQKIFSAADLPAKFDIDVPTPKDKYPVYPKMIFVRREIVTPNGKPLPLPDNAQAPKVEAGDELKTLPNPFLIGIHTGKQNVEGK